MGGGNEIELVAHQSGLAFVRASNTAFLLASLPIRQRPGPVRNVAASPVKHAPETSFAINRPELASSLMLKALVRAFRTSALKSFVRFVGATAKPIAMIASVSRQG